MIPNSERDNQEEDKPSEKPQTSERLDIGTVNENREPEEVVYNHLKENFELLNSTKKTTKPDPRALLPQRFLAKIQRISNQIDFITK